MYLEIIFSKWKQWHITLPFICTTMTLHVGCYLIYSTFNTCFTLTIICSTNVLSLLLFTLLLFSLPSLICFTSNLLNCTIHNIKFQKLFLLLKLFILNSKNIFLENIFLLCFHFHSNERYPHWLCFL